MAFKQLKSTNCVSKTNGFSIPVKLKNKHKKIAKVIQKTTEKITKNSKSFTLSTNFLISVGPLLQRRYKSYPIINRLPKRNTIECEVLVFGTGSMCELGLGPKTSLIVKRPRILPYIPKNIVDIAVGGAHTLALDSEGYIWSWGGNDLGALGRDTSNCEVLKDMNYDESDNDHDDNFELNSKESIPGRVETDIRFAKIAASDSLSLGITLEGDVYAWGSFRNSSGLLGFSDSVKIQTLPIKIKELSNISAIATGRDHVIALTQWGTVLTWGDSENFRLGWRSYRSTLIPRELGLRNIIAIGAGEYHSFAIDLFGRVMSWGLNQYGQCGLCGQSDGATINSPTYIDALNGKDIVSITGGEHHSLALSRDGKIYAFGRYDYHAIGLHKTELPESAFKDRNGNIRCLSKPTILRLGGKDNNEILPPFSAIGAGSHHSLAVSRDGKVWTWGFSESYQTGHGFEEDIETPQMINNTASRIMSIVMAAGGGQFSVITGVRKPE